MQLIFLLFSSCSKTAASPVNLETLSLKEVNIDQAQIFTPRDQQTSPVNGGISPVTATVKHSNSNNNVRLTNINGNDGSNFPENIEFNVNKQPIKQADISETIHSILAKPNTDTDTEQIIVSDLGGVIITYKDKEEADIKQCPAFFHPIMSDFRKFFIRMEGENVTRDSNLFKYIDLLFHHTRENYFSLYSNTFDTELTNNIFFIISDFSMNAFKIRDIKDLYKKLLKEKEASNQNCVYKEYKKQGFEHSNPIFAFYQYENITLSDLDDNNKHTILDTNKTKEYVEINYNELITFFNEMNNDEGEEGTLNERLSDVLGNKGIILAKELYKRLNEYNKAQPIEISINLFDDKDKHLNCMQEAITLINALLEKGESKIKITKCNVYKVIPDDDFLGYWNKEKVINTIKHYQKGHTFLGLRNDFPIRIYNSFLDKMGLEIYSDDFNIEDIANTLKERKEIGNNFIILMHIFDQILRNIVDSTDKKDNEIYEKYINKFIDECSDKTTSELFELYVTNFTKRWS